MRVYVLAAVSIVLLAESALAQEKMGLSNKFPIEQQLEDQRKQADEVDKRYKATIKNTMKDATRAKVDPWAGVRPAEEQSSKR